MQHNDFVLILTNDEHLWEHWNQLSSAQWSVVRANGLDDVYRWLEQGHHLVVVDHMLKPWLDTRWAALSRQLQCVVVSTAPNDTEGQTALAAGARGYVHAYGAVGALERVLRHVAAGEVWVGESLLSRLLSTVSQGLPEMTGDWQSPLTAREIDVAKRAALGHSNQLIATDLGISERTVRAHLSSVFEKLDVTDRLMLTLKVHGIYAGQPS